MKIKKSLTKTALSLLLLLVALTCFTETGHCKQSSLYIKPEIEAMKPETRFFADVGITNSEAVYGMELVLEYDPEAVEIIDADPSSSGIQVAAGDFFDLTRRHYPLQNKAVSEKGTVHYAVSMLNPAPEASGSGSFVRVHFKAKKEGIIDLKLSKCILGTREGVAIKPSLVASRVEVVSAKNPRPIIFATGGIVATCGLLWFVAAALRTRKRRKTFGETDDGR